MQTINNKKVKFKKCTVENCERKQVTNIGYCLMHYKRWKRTGTTKLIKKEFQRDKKCKYCDKKIGKIGAMEMCNKHYQMWRNHGNPLHVEDKRSKPNSKGYFRDRKGKAIQRIKMEEYLGRELLSSEISHHINCIKTDNRIINLYLCTRAEHMAIHQQLRRLVSESINHGSIIFKDGKYSENI